jgi:hypothetical protein
MRRSVLAAFTLLLLNTIACTRLGPQKQNEVVGNTPDVIRAAFNADAGKARVLMLVSPTCGACLEGAAEVTEQIAKINHGRDVPVYVFWVPRRGGLERDVPTATRVVATSWARQYWDGNNLFGVAYKQLLGWRGNAWDVYLLYGPKAQWSGDLPPVPDFFMHQTSERGPRLDALAFSARLKQLQPE